MSLLKEIHDQLIKIVEKEEKNRAYSKAWRDRNPDRVRTYTELYHKKYVENNREEWNRYQRNYTKKRRDIDSQYRERMKLYLNNWRLSKKLRELGTTK